VERRRDRSVPGRVPSPAGGQTGRPAISERQFTGGSAKVTVTGSAKIDEDIAINTKASYGDGGMTWLHGGGMRQCPFGDRPPVSGAIVCSAVMAGNLVRARAGREDGLEGRIRLASRPRARAAGIALDLERPSAEDSGEAPAQTSGPAGRAGNDL
jgi:hypothetical protein